MEHTCKECGKKEMPLGWPEDDLCGPCGRRRDMAQPKPCPFCGNPDGFWYVKENDGSAFWMECSICNAHGPKAPVEGMVIYEWNKRHLQLSRS